MSWLDIWVLYWVLLWVLFLFAVRALLGATAGCFGCCPGCVKVASGLERRALTMSEVAVLVCCSCALKSKVYACVTYLKLFCLNILSSTPPQWFQQSESIRHAQLHLGWSKPRNSIKAKPGA